MRAGTTSSQGSQTCLKTGGFPCTSQAHVTGWRAEGHGRTSNGALEVDPPALAATLPSVSDPHEAVELGLPDPSITQAEE